MGAIDRQLDKVGLFARPCPIAYAKHQQRVGRNISKLSCGLLFQCFAVRCPGNIAKATARCWVCGICNVPCDCRCNLAAFGEDGNSKWTPPELSNRSYQSFNSRVLRVTQTPRISIERTARARLGWHDSDACWSWRFRTLACLLMLE